MCVGYGIDDDNIDNDKDIGCTEFTTTWKIHLILFFKVWAKGRGQGPGPRAKGQGLRVQENQDTKSSLLCYFTNNKQPACKIWGWGEFKWNVLQGSKRKSFL